MAFEMSTRGGYALRAMLHLARRRPGTLEKSRAIAAETGVPAGFLPQVLAALVQRGLVTSSAGPRGGYRLARAAGDVSVLEVVQAVDGPLRSTVCPLRGGPCRSEQPCSLHATWQAAQEALAQRLRSFTLADLVQEDAALTVTGELATGDPPQRPGIPS